MCSRSAVIAVVIAGVLWSCPSMVHAMCCPAPCIDCELFSVGQANVVVMDRKHGTVRVIPNIVLQGSAPDFALIVPTPAFPTFKEVDSTIWSEVRDLTAPVTAPRTFGCKEDGVVAWESDTVPTGGWWPEVVIRDRRTVGAFLVTVLSSENPNALAEWLNSNGYALPDGSAERFAPYVARGWFFTAMKLDLTDPRNQERSWESQVGPVEIQFSATELEVALPIVSINRGEWLPMLFYVVDDHRGMLPAATTLYANRVSGSEYDAIRDLYPALGAYVRPGVFITTLWRVFSEQDNLNESIYLERAPTDDEFRRGIDLGSAALEVWLVALGLVAQRLARPRRRSMPSAQ